MTTTAGKIWTLEMFWYLLIYLT